MCGENWWRPRYTLVQDEGDQVSEMRSGARIVKDNTLWEMGGSILERVVLGAVIGVRIRLSKHFQTQGNGEICSY